MGTQIKYGLRHKSDGYILAVRSEETDADGVSPNYTLCEPCGDTYPMWGVADMENAEWVRLNDTPWYNADYETPINHYEPEDLEVVRIEVSIEPQKVTIPTEEELAERLYGSDGDKPDLERLSGIKKGLERGYSVFSWYDYLEYWDER